MGRPALRYDLTPNGHHPLPACRPENRQQRNTNPSRWVSSQAGLRPSGTPDSKRIFASRSAAARTRGGKLAGGGGHWESDGGQVWPVTPCTHRQHKIIFHVSGTSKYTPDTSDGGNPGGGGGVVIEAPGVCGSSIPERLRGRSVRGRRRPDACSGRDTSVFFSPWASSLEAKSLLGAKYTLPKT